MFCNFVSGVLDKFIIRDNIGYFQVLPGNTGEDLSSSNVENLFDTSFSKCVI